MAKVESAGPYLEPLRKSVTVRRTPAEAFEIFTVRIGSWWPIKGYSIHKAEARTCVLEPGVGGQVYEIAQNGERAPWGHVKAWDPPASVILAWHPHLDPSEAQEVEVRFIAIEGGTRVELEHRDWQNLGAAAADTRNRYDEGWVGVFEQAFREACA